MFNQLHSWRVSPKEAIAIQKRLRSGLVLEDPGRPIETIAGTDVSTSKKSDKVWAGVVVFSYPDLVRLEERWARTTSSFPYIPGLLSFREIPHLSTVLGELKTNPDLVLCDGQGIAHPRGLGLASHLGLLMEKSTIGCAKSLLIGRYSGLGVEKGSRAPLDHKGRVIGAAVRTRTGVKPVFVSPGNRVTLETSIGIVLRCCKKFKIPEPIRQAHLLVTARRRREEAP